jgi:hypothetical protein
MKRFMLVIISISVLLQLQINSGVLCQASAQANENQGYKLKAATVRGENIQLVQFTLESDCYVTVRVMDHHMTLLAEGDMAMGAYNVYYKAKDGKANTSVKCNMEIYRGQNRSEMLCKKEIMLPVN